MLKKITKTKKAGHREREHRPSRPTPREKQRKRQPPTSPPTKSNQDDRKAKRRTEGKRRRHAPSGKAPRTPGHAAPPARTNRKRATTRTHEPRQPPRGTGHQPKSGNRPRDKDTKNQSTPNTTQPQKKPPQPRKKPPQPQKRSTPKTPKSHPDQERRTRARGMPNQNTPSTGSTPDKEKQHTPQREAAPTTKRKSTRPKEKKPTTHRRGDEKHTPYI